MAAAHPSLKDYPLLAVEKRSLPSPLARRGASAEKRTDWAKVEQGVQAFAVARGHASDTRTGSPVTESENSNPVTTALEKNVRPGERPGSKHDLPGKSSVGPQRRTSMARRSLSDIKYGVSSVAEVQLQTSLAGFLPCDPTGWPLVDSQLDPHSA